MAEYWSRKGEYAQRHNCKGALGQWHNKNVYE